IVDIRVLPEVLLHLGMDETCDLALMKTQDLACIIGREVGAQMRDDLLREIVKKIGMLVIGHVVEVDKTADDVILKPLLIYAASTEPDHVDLLRPQMSDP